MAAIASGTGRIAGMARAYKQLLHAKVNGVIAAFKPAPGLPPALAACPG